MAVDVSQSEYRDLRDSRPSKGNSGSLKRKIHYSLDDGDEIPQKKINLVPSNKLQRERGLSDRTNTFSRYRNAECKEAVASSSDSSFSSSVDFTLTESVNDSVFANTSDPHDESTVDCRENPSDISTSSFTDNCGVTNVTTSTSSPQLEESADRNNNDTSISSISSNGSIDRFNSCYKHMGFGMYVTNQVEYLLEHEQKTHVVGFLSNQSDISQKKWSSEVHWLIQLNDRYGYQIETIHLAVNLFNRTLSKSRATFDCLKLLAVACFYIASKQEEIVFPSVKQLLRACKDNYKQIDFFHMEREVLLSLQFCVHAPTVHHFMELYVGCKHHPPTALTPAHVSELMRAKALARFLTLLTTQDYNIIQYKPSLLAWAVLQYAFSVLYQHKRWPLQDCPNMYEDWQIEEAIRDVRVLCGPYLEDTQGRVSEYLTNDDINS